VELQALTTPPRRDPEPEWPLEQLQQERLHPYTRLALQAIMLVLFGGLVIAILGVASALVYWAWTA